MARIDPLPFLSFSRLSNNIPAAAQMTGFSISDAKNNRKQLELIMLIQTEKTLDIIIKMPAVSNNPLL